MPEQKEIETKLQDLTPLPTSALQEAKYEELYSKFDTFNPVSLGMVSAALLSFFYFFLSRVAPDPDAAIPCAVSY